MRRIHWLTSPIILASLLVLAFGLSDAGAGNHPPIRFGLERTFGNRGVLLARIGIGFPRAAVIDQHRRIVLGGMLRYQKGVLARFFGNGRLDASFGSEGVAGHQEAPGETASALAIDSRGRLVVGIGLQQKLSVARYLPDGTLDRTFANGGFTTVMIPSEVGEFGGGEHGKSASISIDAEGRITVARVKVARASGRRGTGFVLVRFREDGALDESFGDSGILTAKLTHKVPFQLTAALADPLGGAAVVATTFTPPHGAGVRELKRFEVVHLRSDGVFDPSFGGGDGITQIGVGRYGTAASVAAIDSRGRIVVGGSNAAGYGFARLRPDGTLDKRFGRGGKLTIAARPALPKSDIRAIAIDRLDRVVVAGRVAPSGLFNDYFLAFRLRSGGSVDRTFGRRGLCAASFPGRQAYPTALALFPGGDAVITGAAERPLPGAYVPTAPRLPAFALARCDG